MKTTLLTIGLVLLTAPLLAWADEDDPQAKLRADIDALVEPLITSETMKGIAVGVVKDGKLIVRGYGKTADGGAAPDGKHVFEIGSISKVFTGILLAELVADGKVALDDPVGKHLPDTVKMPELWDTKITLRHLATHTSGLPSLPAGFEPKDPKNPYADYTVDQMYKYLSAHKLKIKPGAKYGYSNLGMGLLGHALARVAGKSYEALVTERIGKPLGMSDTCVTLTDELKKRLATGHDGSGSPTSNWDVPTLAGAGALRSTVDDLLTFMQVQLKGGDGQLYRSMATAVKSHHEMAQGILEIGLAWHISPREGFTWHNGGTGGYSSFCAFHKEKQLAVVVLCNTGTLKTTELGRKIGGLLLGRKIEPMKVRTEIKLDPKVLDRYVGRYALAPTFVLTVTNEGGKLMVQATGQTKLRVFPESETKFFWKVVDAQLTFVKNADGVYDKCVLHQGGREVPGKRLADEKKDEKKDD